MGGISRAVLALVLAASEPIAGVGCVERRLFVRSDPEPAQVFLDGEPRGQTPLRIPFTYYGTRELVLRAPGRRARRLAVEILPPWYQITPLDFVSELLLPFTIVDEREVFATLLPSPPRALEELSSRAEEARRAGGGD